MYILHIVSPFGNKHCVACRWRWYARLLGAFVETFTDSVTFVTGGRL